MAFSKCNQALLEAAGLPSGLINSLSPAQIQSCAEFIATNPELHNRVINAVQHVTAICHEELGIDPDFTERTIPLILLSQHQETEKKAAHAIGTLIGLWSNEQRKAKKEKN